MKNKIFYTTEKEFENKFRKKELRRNSFIVEINGSEIQTWPDFLAKMTEAFNLPYSPNANVYLDWMRDMDYITEKSTCVVIKQYSQLIKEDQHMKEIVIKDFSDYILPWWEGEIIGHMVGGKPQRFVVYLCD